MLRAAEQPVSIPGGISIHADVRALAGPSTAINAIAPKRRLRRNGGAPNPCAGDAADAAKAQGSARGRTG